jgi:hypothetical protein
MRLLRFLGGAFSVILILGLLAVTLPAGAQTLDSLTAERVLVLTGIHSSLSPNLPASVLASLASGTLEIHEQTNYNPQASTLTSTVFLMPANSTPPTNLGTVPQSNILAVLAINAAGVYVTKSAVELVGLVSSTSTPLYGTASYQGAPAVYSFGYTTDTPPKIHDVTESVAGAVVVWTSTATGTFTITQPSSGGGGGTGTGTGVTVVVTGPGGSSMSNTFATNVNQVTLNAGGSMSANAGALTYSWSIPMGAPSAAISFPGGNTAMPLIQLVSGMQTYTVELTVTDSTGATATATITIMYQ